MFVLVADMYGLSYEDHFRDHQRVDQCGSIGEVRNMEPAEQEHAVGRERAKEKGQIQKEYGNFPKFPSGLLLQAGFWGIRGAHLIITFPADIVSAIMTPTGGAIRLTSVLSPPVVR